jgi:L-glutamine:2-deoxy-scyllo-inosose/3-amino-2,3-dideoxy-scyllo-inosose aminotransferase
MTAGEGGALTTSDPELYERLDALRNCGRRPEKEESADKGAGLYGSEGDFIQSGNYRITDFQAALLIESLKRLPEHNRIRGGNAKYLNTLLAGCPGVQPMKNDETEALGACYNYSFRYNKDQFKGLDVAKFREALGKELGCSVEASYEPLNACSLYTPHTKLQRHNLSEEYWQTIDPATSELPVCHRIYKEESVCFHHSILMGPQADMDLITGAVEKIYNNAEELLESVR